MVPTDLIVSGLLYNLYADRELGLDLVPQSVYEMQSDFYPTVEEKFGVPLDTRHLLTKSEFSKHEKQREERGRGRERI